MASRKKNDKRGRKRQGSTTKEENRKEMTPNDKIALYLNEALAIENAAIPRLQSRIRETPLKEAKLQLQHHLEETKEQQDRLRQLILNLGSKPTGDKAHLPIVELPGRLSNSIKRSATPAEQELKRTKEDAIIENAEVVMYDTLMQLAQIMGVSNALPVLTQNLTEERDMADWIRSNTPAVITQLYPKIESSIVPEKQQPETTSRIAEA